MDIVERPLDELRNLIVMELGVRKSKDVLALLDKALEAETEECAKVAAWRGADFDSERPWLQSADHTYAAMREAQDIASAIRARKTSPQAPASP